MELGPARMKFAFPGLSLASHAAEINPRVFEASLFCFGEDVVYGVSLDSAVELHAQDASNVRSNIDVMDQRTFGKRNIRSGREEHSAHVFQIGIIAVGSIK